MEVCEFLCVSVPLKEAPRHREFSNFTPPKKNGSNFVKNGIPVNIGHGFGSMNLLTNQRLRRRC